MFLIVHCITDVYEDNLEELGAEPRTMFNLLEQKLNEEEDLIISLSELQGTLHMLLSAAETAQPITIREPTGLEPSSAAQTNLVLSIS